MTKIISYVEVDGMLTVLTDNPGRPYFVYPVDRFKTLEQLQSEIWRSIALEEYHKVKKVAGTAPLKAALDVEVAANASK